MSSFISNKTQNTSRKTSNSKSKSKSKNRNTIKRYSNRPEEMLNDGQKKYLSLNSAFGLIDDLKKKINNLLENLKQMATENRELVNVNKELVKENSELFKENNRLKKQSGTLNNQLHNNRIEMEQYKNKIDNYMSTYKKIKPNLDENRSLIDARLISVKEDVERHIDNLSILERNGITMIPDPYKYFS